MATSVNPTPLKVVTGSVPSSVEPIPVQLFDAAGNPITLGGGGTPIALPVPRIALSGVNTKKTFKYYDAALAHQDATIINPPACSVQDIPTELFGAGYKVYVEMVLFKLRRKNKIKKPTAPSGMIPVVPISDTFPWGVSPAPSTRCGIPNTQSGLPNYNIPCNNWIPVTANGQILSLTKCLDGHLKQWDVDYRDTTSTGLSDTKTLSVLSLIQKRGMTNCAAGIYAYGGRYRVPSIAFRYLLWDTTASARGRFITGPLSPIIRVQYSRFPFMKNWASTVSHGFAVCDLNPFFNMSEFVCRFQR